MKYSHNELSSVVTKGLLLVVTMAIFGSIKWCMHQEDNGSFCGGHK